MVNEGIIDRYRDFLLTRKSSLMYYHFADRFIVYLNENNISLDAITTEILTNYLKEHLEYKPGTINNFLKMGRHLFSFLYGENNSNPFKSTKLLKEEERLPVYLTEDELHKAIDYLISIERNFSPEKIKALMGFIFYSGLRRGEILSLKRDQFNLKEGTVRVIIAKTKEEDIRVFTDEVKSLLSIYFNSEQEEENAFNITKSQMISLLSKLNEVFPGKKISPHKFRNSFAVAYLNNGGSLAELKDLLGHKNIQTTMRYAKFTKENLHKRYREVFKKKRNHG